MKTILIGTSGWSYKHWKGVFYPEKLPQNRWLSFYAEHFKTVEINMTFYRTPTEKTVAGWLEKTPDDFSFTIKASRYITHVKRTDTIDESIEKLYSLMEQFGRKGRCILFQLPPSFDRSGENVKRIDTLLAMLDRRYDHAFEFRHTSWWADEGSELFRGRAAFCTVNGLGMPDDTVVTDRIAYFRFHGKHYDTSYSDEELSRCAERITSLLQEGIERVYVYFNNDFYGYAVQNAKRLRELILP
jgi:uncharacterized protein YecE (DUF72 family)